MDTASQPTTCPPVSGTWTSGTRATEQVCGWTAALPGICSRAGFEGLGILVTMPQEEPGARPGQARPKEGGVCRPHGGWALPELAEGLGQGWGQRGVSLPGLDSLELPFHLQMRSLSCRVQARCQL